MQNLFDLVAAIRKPSRKHTGEATTFQITEDLIQTGARLLARPIIKFERFRRRSDSPCLEQTLPPAPAAPTGPFHLQRSECSLLLYVPRNIVSRMIDEFTGAHGFSHVAVDCGEIDVATGKGVMVESIMEVGVHRAFLDEYGPRAFLRIPLNEVRGIDIHDFRARILSKIGEKYDFEEALTWGMVDDPARQICSDLVTVCLPAEIQQDIARCHQAGEISWESVSVHQRADGRTSVFISPNGFAEYFGAPRGRRVDNPDVTFRPSPRVVQPGESAPGAFPWGWAMLGAALCLGLLGWILWNRRKGV
jgi:hypothetical protein